MPVLLMLARRLLLGIVVCGALFWLLPATAAATCPPTSARDVCPPTPPPPVLPSPTPTPTALPSPSPSPTPQGNLNVDPVSAPAGSRVTVSGNGFPANQTFPLYLNGSDPFDSITTDGSGNFSKETGLPTVPPGDYQMCVKEGSGPVCAYVHIVTASSPSPETSPTVAPTAAPSPSPSPSPSPAAPAALPPPSGSSPLGYLIQPPFVFFPAILLLAAVAWLAYWLWSLRPPPGIAEEIRFEHRAPLPREKSIDVELVQAAGPPPPIPPTPPPAAPVVYESAAAEAPEPEAGPPRASDVPSQGDLPPDLPAPSE